MNQSEKIVCAFCHGRGVVRIAKSLKNKFHLCHDCKGTGMETETRESGGGLLWKLIKGP